MNRVLHTKIKMGYSDTSFSTTLPDNLMPANAGTLTYTPGTPTKPDIGAEAFKNCTGLEQIRLPKECVIEEGAFENCGTVCVFAPAGGKTEEFCNKTTNPCVLISIEDTAQDN